MKGCGLMCVNIESLELYLIKKLRPLIQMKFAGKTNIFNKPLQIKIFLRISHLVSFHFIK